MTTFTVEKPNASDYLINGEPDPTLNLIRGETYTFNFIDDGHPFFIKSFIGPGTTGRYDAGVVNQGSRSADQDLTFTVPLDAPDVLYYQCSVHPGMQGQLLVSDGEVGINADEQNSTVTLIVEPGHIGPSPVVLNGLVEVKTGDAWTIEYAGLTFNYADIDPIVTLVTRDDAYTQEFRAEIAEAYPEYAGYSYEDTIDLVGLNSINATLLHIAAADGQIIG